MSLHLTFNNANGLRRTASLPATTAWTACGWFWFDSTSGGATWNAIFTLENATVNATTQLIFGWDAANNFVLASTSIANFPSFPPTGQWIFCAVTAGSTTLTGYWRSLTGAFVTQTQGGWTDFTPAMMGCCNSSYQLEGIDGRLAGIRVWDAVLTQAELELEMWSFRAVRRANLHLETPIVDRVLADNLVDISGNARNWTQNGTPTVLKAGPPIPWRIGGRRRHAYSQAGGATAALSGTVQPDATKAEIVAGGQTIILTLTGATWKPN